MYIGVAQITLSFTSSWWIDGPEGPRTSRLEEQMDDPGARGSGCRSLVCRAGAGVRLIVGSRVESGSGDGLAWPTPDAGDGS
jgi:hypothetical protein